ncbi:MAG: hypothetical protein C0393_08075 [Anaerolinea sp.]|nr:hypothetical protein [Anaerolinea sp.]
MSQNKIILSVAGDVNQVSRDYAQDDRFALGTVQNDWRIFTEVVAKSEPDVVLIYGDATPGPDALVNFLSRLKRAVAIVLLPPSQAQFQGRIESAHTVRKVYILPVAAAEVLNFAYNAIQTEIAKTHSAAPLQQVYASAGSGRAAAAAVGIRVVGLVSAQGGVGKTTLAEALGFELAAHRNFKTLLASFDLPPVAAEHFPNLKFAVNASEFFARPEDGFHNSIQTTADGLEVLLAPSASVAYAQAAAVEDPYARNSIRSLVTQAFTRHYAAVLLDLPVGEGAWTLQPLLTANTVLILSRPTVDGIRATAHVVDLLTKQITGQHRIPKEAIYVVLNQMTSKSSLTATSFVKEGSAHAGWFPPVLAVVDYDPAIPQAQDNQRPVNNASETLSKAAIAIADAFYGGERSTKPAHKKQFGGIKFTVKG